MKLFIVLCLAAAVAAAPQNRGNYKFSPDNVQILENQFDNIGVGPYTFRFLLSDGTSRQEEGVLRNQGTPDEFVAVQGQYAYNAPNGIRYTVKYTADDNGYQPTIEEGPGFSPDAAASLLG